MISIAESAACWLIMAGTQCLASSIGGDSIMAVEFTVPILWHNLCCTLKIHCFGKRAKPVQPMVYSFDKPAKQRILEASDKLFRIFGIRAGIRAIAFEAHSNDATVIKHFGHQERLAALFIKSLIEIAEKGCRELEIDYPDDA